MFVDKVRSLQWKAYQQTLDKDGQACQGQTLSTKVRQLQL